jgi:hypothetical protein
MLHCANLFRPPATSIWHRNQDRTPRYCPRGRRAGRTSGQVFFASHSKGLPEHEQASQPPLSAKPPLAFESRHAFVIAPATDKNPLRLARPIRATNMTDSLQWTTRVVRRKKIPDKIQKFQKTRPKPSPPRPIDRGTSFPRAYSHWLLSKKTSPKVGHFESSWDSGSPNPSPHSAIGNRQ